MTQKLRRSALTGRAFAAVSLVTLIALVIPNSKEAENHLRILERVSLGSKVAELVPLLKEPSVEGSQVRSRVISIGVSRTEDMGVLTESLAEKLDGMADNCQISLYVYGPWFEARVLIFRYENGRLVGKDWGHLPG